MDEATLERTASKIESALSSAPEALAAARELLTNQQAQSRKRAVIFVEDEQYRRVLASALGEKFEIQTPGALEEAIELLGSFPGVVICELKAPSRQRVQIIRRMRRASSSCPIFVRTADPEEDGQVAAAGAIGYRASEKVADLARTVTSAIEASSWLSGEIQISLSSRRPLAARVRKTRRTSQASSCEPPVWTSK